MYSLKNYLLFSSLLSFNFLAAQNYQAINGSPYAGSLAPGSNPAFIVNVPYAWDITPLAVQIKQTTNAFTIENYSFLSSPKNAVMIAQPGIKKRWVFANQDVRLLNTRININEKSAIAFGANIRNYVYANTSENNWQDTTLGLTDFMNINVNNVPLSGQSINSTWSELYASYAHTIIDNGKIALNAGITLKYNRALAFGYVNAQNLSYTPDATTNVPGYLLTAGSLQYNYSSNFDNIDNNASGNSNFKNFYRSTLSGVSADLGLELILVSNDNEGESNYSYQTKIGMSIMDIGRNKYIQGIYSSYATAGLPGITNIVLENKFAQIASVADFTDSLKTITQTFSQLSGNFNVYQPCRLMINVDQHLANDFSVNAEITIPLLSIVPKKLIYVKDMNLLAITPRWETKSFGGYLPLTINTKGQIWIGGAIKAGPLLLGTHNLGTLFSKNKTQTGGFYLAFTIRPAKKSEDQQSGYRTDKLTRKERRNLDCPKL
jgi:hypothetical protein